MDLEEINQRVKNLTYSASYFRNRYRDTFAAAQNATRAVEHAVANNLPHYRLRARTNRLHNTAREARENLQNREKQAQHYRVMREARHQANVAQVIAIANAYEH